MVKPIPDNYPQLSPYLIVDDASRALDFYAQIFGAKERGRMPMPNGKIGHAEIQIGDSVVMLADEWPENDVYGPKSMNGTPVTLHIYVEDVDNVFERAIDAGATVVQDVKDQFYGDRSGVFVDPFGHKWNVASHVEDVTPDEMERRAQELFAG